MRAYGSLSAACGELPPDRGVPSLFGAGAGPALPGNLAGSAFDFPDQDEAALRRRLGEAAGQALMDIITPSDVLGLSWARSLSGLAAALTRMPPCPIVQLTGAVPPPGGRDLLEPVRSVARIGGGTAHVFYSSTRR